ncbi:hypothetical protein GF386_06295 [Candidatus Pacearchaeota archaeon]|nr:hypothetical protein [Candidatus Pacearchaeota archaeon]MBD3283699.1 hypothetical protein [Candidatus Pacearchaeota archaeon]
MKKIISKSEKDKKSRKNQLIVGLVLILLMVLSTLGFALTGRTEDKNNEKIEYRDVVFIRESGFWISQIKGKNFITTYNAREVENFSFPGYLTIENYRNNPLYFVGDGGNPVSEIARNLEDVALRMQNACLSENCSENLPVKNCSTDNIIIIKEPLNEEENIYQKENCVFIIGSYQNQTKMADAFLFHLAGI